MMDDKSRISYKGILFSYYIYIYIYPCFPCDYVPYITRKNVYVFYLHHELAFHEACNYSIRV